MHSSCKIYYSFTIFSNLICSCGEDYAREIKRNVSLCYDEHNNPPKKLKAAAHLENNNDHYFTWKILWKAPSNARTRKNIDAFFIAIMKPTILAKTYETNFSVSVK